LQIISLANNIYINYIYAHLNRWKRVNSIALDDFNFYERIFAMKKIAVVLVPVLLAACSSMPAQNASQASQAASKPATNESRVIEKSISVSSAEIEAKKLAAEVQELQKQSIYFDFDKYVVKPEYLEVVRRQAEFIKAHKNDIVTVEGNADERGSNEYNLALGEKRATTARKNLELLGIPATQINTVSFGEEKPRLSCHEEKCWKENRRDDFAHKLN
jgi:peptidoglycan-associated lipoprotein